jgi:hypothetical protein
MTFFVLGLTAPIPLTITLALVFGSRPLRVLEACGLYLQALLIVSNTWGGLPSVMAAVALPVIVLYLLIPYLIIERMLKRRGLLFPHSFSAA